MEIDSRSLILWIYFEAPKFVSKYFISEQISEKGDQIWNY